MHRALDRIPTATAPGPFDARLSAGLTALGLVAAPGGLPAIFRVVLQTVFEAARPLVAYL